MVMQKSRGAESYRLPARGQQPCSEPSDAEAHVNGAGAHGETNALEPQKDAERLRFRHHGQQVARIFGGCSGGEVECGLL